MNNREFKFRVWDEDDNVFRYFDLKDENRDLFWFSHTIPNYLERIQQFTGLLDSQRKEIYEGDIIEKTGINLADQFTYGLTSNDLHWSKIGDIFVVYYLPSGFTLLPIETYKSDYICPNLYGNIGQYNFWNGASSATKIVGNIFENPELLNKTND